MNTTYQYGNRVDILAYACSFSFYDTPEAEFLMRNFVEFLEFGGMVLLPRKSHDLMLIKGGGEEEMGE